MTLPDDINVFECSNAFIWKGADNFIYLISKSEIHIEIGTHKESFATIKQLCDGHRYGLIVDLNGIKGMDRVSRVYTGSEEHLGYIYGAALLASNPIDTMIGHFIKGINKPKYPTRLFTNIIQAKKWLNTIPEDMTDKTT